MSRKFNDGKIITDRETMKAAAYDIISEIVDCHNASEDELQPVSMISTVVTLDKLINKICGDTEEDIEV